MILLKEDRAQTVISKSRPVLFSCFAAVLIL